MEVCELENVLKSIESEWRERFRDLPRADCIDHSIDPVFFAWDKFPAADASDVGHLTISGPEIVVCVGINYGQGSERGPKTDGRHAHLGSWIRNYRLAADSLMERNRPESQAWRDHHWLVGQIPTCPRYFVMTNVVPWITRVAWTQLPKEEARALVEAASLQPSHLDELHDKLGGAFAVAHGIHEMTMPHVQDAVRRRWSNRLFYANLSRPWLPGAWDTQRFRFRRPPKAAT